MGVQVSFELEGELGEYVEAVTGEGGDYADMVDYLRDLIRRDLQAMEAHQFRTVKEHLQEAFAAPESDYIEMAAEDFLREMNSEEE